MAKSPNNGIPRKGEPLPQLHRAEERALIAQLTIDLIKVLHRGRLKRGRIAGEVEMLLMAGVVLIGHVKGAPRTASQISRSLGIPRATVQRKLAELQKRGVIASHKGQYHFLTDAGDHSYVDKALALIASAAAQSKRA
jgi:biotin operon repressor